MKRKLLCLLLSMLLVTTTAQAAEKAECCRGHLPQLHLTLQYAASGQTVRLYRAADISSNGRYTLCGAFAGIRHLYARRERSGGGGMPCVTLCWRI